MHCAAPRRENSLCLLYMYVVLLQPKDEVSYDMILRVAVLICCLYNYGDDDTTTTTTTAAANNNNNKKKKKKKKNNKYDLKKAEKILKYKDFIIEIRRMWNVKPKVIPVIIGATGTISKSFRKYVSNIPGKHEVKELQKTATLGTAHILRKVLM